MKRSVYALFIILMTLFSINSVMANSNVGCRGGWYIELEPFAAKINDDWTRGRFASAFPTNDSNYRLHDKDYNWGGHIALGYDFISCSPCYYWGASIEYTHLDSDDNKQTSNDGFISGEFGVLDFGPFTSAKADFDSKYDALDFLVHYHIATPACIQTQVFAGIRYARIDESLQVGYRFDPEITAFAGERELSVSVDRDFRGIGPEVGLGIFAPVYCGFGVTAEALGGYMHSRHCDHFGSRFDTFVNGESLFNDDNCFRHENNDWVPFAAAHAGLAYQATLCNCSIIRLEAGYRYDRYFDVLQTWNDHCHCDCQFNPEERRDQDFEFQGPYLKLTWHI